MLIVPRSVLAGVAFAFALQCVPTAGSAQSAGNACYDEKASADQTIAACGALIIRGDLTGREKANLYFNRARAYFHKGQFDLAIADDSAGLRLKPDDGQALSNRGGAFAQKNKYDLAIADYTAALRIDPNDVASLYGREEVYRAQHQYDLASADENAALRLSPNSARSYVERGQTYAEKRDYAHAIDYYTAALRIDPTSAGVYVLRGTSYAAMGRPELGIADLSAAVRIAPSASTYTTRAWNYGIASQYDLADADYAEALRIDPKYALAYQDRGHQRFDLAQLEGAISDLTRSADLAPGDAYAALWLHIARLRLHGNDTELAARSGSLDAKWPAPVVALYLGRQTPEQVVVAANNDRERCEATFFVAEWRLWHQQIAQAQNGFSQVAAICHPPSFVFSAARAELNRLPK